jgi:hypothetical protein
MTTPDEKREAEREAFEKAYAERSGISVEVLHAYGQRAEPCDCDEDGCKGWKMVPPKPQWPVTAPTEFQRDKIVKLLDEAKAELEAVRIDEDLHDRDLEIVRLRKALELIALAIDMHVKL